MNQLSPKQQFTANAAECAEFSGIASSWIVQKAMTHAMAQMALAGRSAEEMAGARYFVNRFLNMAEANEEESKEPQSKYPTKPLKTYG